MRGQFHGIPPDGFAFPLDRGVAVFDAGGEHKFLIGRIEIHRQGAVVLHGVILSTLRNCRTTPGAPKRDSKFRTARSVVGFGRVRFSERGLAMPRRKPRSLKRTLRFAESN